MYNQYIYIWNRLKRWVPLVEQELLTLSENMSSPPVFSGVHVTRSLVVCVCFVDRCLSLCTFSFRHCIVCSWAIWVVNYLATHTSLSPIRLGFAPVFVNYKKGALDSQPQVIKFASCLPIVSGYLLVLRLLPPLKLVTIKELLK